MMFVRLFNSLKNRTNEQNNEASAFEKKITTSVLLSSFIKFGLDRIKKIHNNWIRFQK